MVRGTHHHVESGSPHDADTEAAPEIVMFFLGPDGEFLDQDPNAAPHRTLADVRRAWHTALESEAAHDPWARNRLGPRPVQGIGRPGKAGFLDEILVTARSGPERAVAVAVGPGLFSPPVVGALSVSVKRTQGAPATGTLGAKLALTVVAAPSLTVQVVAVPVQPLVQPPKV